MADSLKFGPEWLRNLSDGSHTNPHQLSPLPKFKPADFRYNKQELLDNFDEDYHIPDELKELDLGINSEKILLPMAFIPMNDIEQKLLFQSGNINNAISVVRSPLGKPLTSNNYMRIDSGRGRSRGRGDVFHRIEDEFTKTNTNRHSKEDGSSRGWGSSHCNSGVRSFENSQHTSSMNNALTYAGSGIYGGELSRSTSIENWRGNSAGTSKRWSEDDNNVNWRKTNSKQKLSNRSWREPWDKDSHGNLKIRTTDDAFRDKPSSYSKFSSDKPSSHFSSSYSRSFSLSSAVMAEQQINNPTNYNHYYHSNQDKDPEQIPEWSTDDGDDIGTFDASGAFITLKDSNELEQCDQKSQVNSKSSKFGFRNNLSSLREQKNEEIFIEDNLKDEKSDDKCFDLYIKTDSQVMENNKNNKYSGLCNVNCFNKFSEEGIFRTLDNLKNTNNEINSKLEEQNTELKEASNVSHNISDYDNKHILPYNEYEKEQYFLKNQSHMNLFDPSFEIYSQNREQHESILKNHKDKTLSNNNYINFQNFEIYKNDFNNPTLKNSSNCNLFNDHSNLYINEIFNSNNQQIFQLKNKVSDFLPLVENNKKEHNSSNQSFNLYQHQMMINEQIRHENPTQMDSNSNPNIENQQIQNKELNKNEYNIENYDKSQENNELKFRNQDNLNSQLAVQEILNSHLQQSSCKQIDNKHINSNEVSINDTLIKEIHKKEDSPKYQNNNLVSNHQLDHLLPIKNHFSENNFALEVANLEISSNNLIHCLTKNNQFLTSHCNSNLIYSIPKDDSYSIKKQSQNAETFNLQIRNEESHNKQFQKQNTIDQPISNQQIFNEIQKFNKMDEMNKLADKQFDLNQYINPNQIVNPENKKFNILSMEKEVRKNNEQSYRVFQNNESLKNNITDNLVHKTLLSSESTVELSILKEKGFCSEDHPDSNKWFYRDPQGEIQGSFTQSEMCEWFSAGYFNMGLMVKQGRDQQFVPLGTLLNPIGHNPFLSHLLEHKATRELEVLSPSHEKFNDSEHEQLRIIQNIMQLQTRSDLSNINAQSQQNWVNKIQSMLQLNNLRQQLQIPMQSQQQVDYSNFSPTCIQRSASQLSGLDLSTFSPTTNIYTSFGYNRINNLSEFNRMSQEKRGELGNNLKELNNFSEIHNATIDNCHKDNLKKVDNFLGELETLRINTRELKKGDKINGDPLDCNLRNVNKLEIYDHNLKVICSNVGSSGNLKEFASNLGGKSLKELNGLESMNNCSANQYQLNKQLSEKDKLIWNNQKTVFPNSWKSTGTTWEQEMGGVDINNHNLIALQNSKHQIILNKQPNQYVCNNIMQNYENNPRLRNSTTDMGGGDNLDLLKRQISEELKRRQQTNIPFQQPYLLNLNKSNNSTNEQLVTASLLNKEFISQSSNLNHQALIKENNLQNYQKNLQRPNLNSWLKSSQECSDNQFRNLLSINELTHQQRNQIFQQNLNQEISSVNKNSVIPQSINQSINFSQLPSNNILMNDLMKYLLNQQLQQQTVKKLIQQHHKEDATSWCENMLKGQVPPDNIPKIIQHLNSLSTIQEVLKVSVALLGNIEEASIFAQIFFEKRNLSKILNSETSQANLFQQYLGSCSNNFNSNPGSC